MNRAQKYYEEFLKFHQQNPQVWVLFEKFTLECINRGFKRYSADAVIHRVRWETDIVTVGGIFKINDHHVTYYARMFHANHLEHEGFFKIRELTSLKKSE